ncbi:uncharacterized protein LOC111260585 [Varroa jacobsoni]|uniref:uncharacterized protein LOC111260585 n=1 Tax=Varroa jacobsoni TaxID=62625 RepID=UPI000BF2CD7C|nr:uncharacterized protein LOC111260585 [Varroa jacobsoni]
MTTDDSNENSPGLGTGRSFVLIEPSEYNLILLVLRRLFLCLLLLFLMGLGALAMWMDTDRRYSGFFLALIAFSGTLAVVRKGTHLHDGEGILADDEDAVMHTSSHYTSSCPYPPYPTSPQGTPKHSNSEYRYQHDHQRGPPPQFSEEDPDASDGHHSHGRSHHAGVHSGARTHHGPNCSGGVGVAGWLPPPPPPPYHMACPEPPPAYFDIVPNLMDQQNSASLSRDGGQHRHQHHHYVDVDALFQEDASAALGATIHPLPQQTVAAAAAIQSVGSHHHTTAGLDSDSNQNNCSYTLSNHLQLHRGDQGQQHQQFRGAVAAALRSSELLIQAETGPSTSGTAPSARAC